MNLPRLSVKRPVFTTMVTLIVVLIGAMSLVRLPIDLLPDVSLPTLTISTSYENASPEEMERLVTEVVEQAVSAVAGVEELNSVSGEGVSNVRVSFVWGTDLDAASNDIRDRLDRLANQLPEDAQRPQLRKFDIANFPILFLGVDSDLDPIELTQIIEEQVQYRIERVAGVAAAETWGGFTREVQVNLDPDRIKALALPLDTIIQSIRESNISLPVGEIEQGRYEVTLRTPGEFSNLDELRNTVIAMRAGAPVMLGQIAEVEDTHEKIRRIIRINGRPGVRMGVRKQPGANTVQVATAVEAEIERINADFPQLTVTSVFNQAEFIERSINNVANTVMIGGVLAVAVLLFFLRNIRSTAVIATAIPISIIATFALIYFGGFTLNLMTLGGLALGVGMMVDNSIVVLENIFRRMDEEKETRITAAVNGTGEVAGAIVASTITTLVIFLPLVFLEGVAGVLFRQMAYVIAFSLICSLLVALSLVPMLAGRLLRSAEEVRTSRPGWLNGAVGLFDRAFNVIDDLYRSLLSGALGMRLATVGLGVAVLGGTLFLMPLIGSEFMPPSDEGELRVTGTMEVGTRLDIVDRQTRLMESLVIPEIPELTNVVVSIGPSGFRPDEGAEGELRISLTPAAERERSNEQVANDVRKAIEGKIPGMEIRTRAPQGQFLLNRLVGGDEDLTIEVRGYDLEVLDLLAQRAAELILTVPGVTDLQLSRKTGIPQEMIRIDRSKAADMGLSVRQIASALESAVAGSRAGEYREGGDEFRILVKLKEAEKLSLEELLDLTLSAPNGEQVALRNLVELEPGRGPNVIDRRDQQRMVSIRANIADRDLGSIAADAMALLESVPRPVGYEFVLGGNYEEQQRSFEELMISLVLALVLVYMVLACQYESLCDPLIVMVSVPMAAIGVLITLFLTGSTLNVQSYIGCIMLGGIVVNNAILLVDQAGQLRMGGMSSREAVAEAGRRRLRPILMTTLTTILGLMPLALGIGEGADAQAPLARAVVGGLASSTLITLLLVPAIYSIVHPDRRAAAA